MRSSLDSRKSEEPAEDTDITLGGGSLLAIFFGILLVCGLVFGFGYSLGRHRATPPPASSGGNNTVTATSPAHKMPAADQATDTAQESTAKAERSNPNFPPDYTAPVPDEAGGEQASHGAHSADVNHHRPSVNGSEAPTANAAKPHATVAASPTTGASATGQGAPVMVQIAAVSRKEDAEVLAAALRRRGFAPMLRHGLADGFYHVQVGPFTDRAQAVSMRDRLQSDGYNAFLK